MFIAEEPGAKDSELVQTKQNHDHATDARKQHPVSTEETPCRGKTEAQKEERKADAYYKK